jgi:hypothetical protein
MEIIYGKGFEYMKIFGYFKKGCGKKEQGISVLIEPNVQETRGGLGFHPLEMKQASKKTSLNINTIMFNSDSLPLKHLEFIDSICEELLE